MQYSEQDDGLVVVQYSEQDDGLVGHCDGDDDG